MQGSGVKLIEVKTPALAGRYCCSCSYGNASEVLIEITGGDFHLFYNPLNFVGFCFVDWLRL